MKKNIFLLFAVVIILGLMSGVVLAEGAAVTRTVAVELISVLDCPLVGFALVHYLDNDELFVQIEAIGPPEVLAGEVLEFRYEEGEEQHAHRFTIDEHGRGSLHVKTPALAEQHLNVWSINAQEYILEIFADHPRLLVEDGHLHSLESEILIGAAL